ncbi:MAG: aromatic ring-hydroxylating dioxygenase subunit alpha [Reyranella sp.]|nr:MAG: aromatic ring-hydroxylating dioxygenase subunit alpha [Reyranella sp.]
MLASTKTCGRIAALDGKWVRNAWYVAGWSHDLVAGRIEARVIIDQPLALYRKQDGQVVALEDRCCHRFAPLSMGRLEQDDLRCMYHGLKFASDGRCIEIPGQKLIPQSACVRRYPAAERGGWIWIWMGEESAADLRSIPDPVRLDDPAYCMRSGQMDYAAHYLLIDDNLLDLSHLSYAHEKTLGLDMPQWADERPRISALERGLRVQRWLCDQPSRGFMKRWGETLDLWNSYDFLFPGIFLLRTAFYPVGTARRLDRGEPQEPPLFLRYDDQAVTPMTDRTTRYFYAAGARSADIDPERVGRLFGIVEAAFAEDKAIIEAQQKVIDREPGRRMLPTSLDAGPTQFRKLVQALLEQDGRPGPAATAQVG